MIVQHTAPHLPTVERWATTGPVHWRSIWAGVRDVRFGVAMVKQTKQAFRLAPTHLPVLLYVGDDMLQALGPAGFHRRSLRRVIETCDGAVVVSCEPLPALYDAAAATAADGRNVVLIETQPEQEIPWVEFLRACRPDIGLFLGSVTGGTA